MEVFLLFIMKREKCIRAKTKLITEQMEKLVQKIKKQNKQIRDVKKNFLALFFQS